MGIQQQSAQLTWAWAQQRFDRGHPRAMRVLHLLLHRIQS